MSGAASIELDEIMATKAGSVDPAKFADEVFDLYSIPAFDRGEPEVVAGKEIGSAKQIVEPGDVLLSKIVPHIRRSWVVGANRGRRIIASGEWIVFRSDRVQPGYLRHVLVGDPFHAQFMSTVSGVGGSLLRARPAHVARIKIPLPPLREQRRIAEILDKADALRAKRRAALAQLDTLAQSIFLEMFDDPAANPKSWRVVSIGDICDVKGGKRLPKGEEYSSVPTPFRYIRVVDLKGGRVDEAALVYLDPEIQASISRYVVNTGDVIISIAGSIGLVAAVPQSLDGANLTENAAKLVQRQSGQYEAEYLARFLESDHAQGQVRSHVGQVTIGKLALFRIEKIKVPLPPIEVQREFVRRLAAVDSHAAVQRAAASRSDELFASLQFHAFRGSL